MSTFDLTVTTLSPLHIGDGDELRQGFDFIIHQGKTYRLDEDAVLLAKEDRLRPGANGHYPLPGALLDLADYNNPGLFRYILNGEPRSSKADARLRSFIKDYRDRPYIPGSSLKGAVRTALAWTGWPEIRPRLDRQTLGKSKSWAGQPLEKMLFGPNPNHDLLRALQITDLFGPELPGQGLSLMNAQVLTRRNLGSPVELEGMRRNISFKGILKIDEALFSNQAESELHFRNRKQWLDELPKRVQTHSLARIQRLAAWFDKTSQAEEIARFYHELESFNCAPNQALMQIGWGAGWDGKTFWTRIQQDAALFEQITRDFRLLRNTRSGQRVSADEFPSSRRVAMIVRERVSRPAAPFGWVLMELTKR